MSKTPHHPRISPRHPRSLAHPILAAIALAVVSSPLAAQGPGNTVRGTRMFVLEEPHREFATAQAACQAIAQDRGRQLVGSKDAGDGYLWCELQDTDGQKTDQHYGVGRVICPDHSGPGSGDECACDDHYLAKGTACVEDLADGARAAAAASNAAPGDSSAAASNSGGFSNDLCLSDPAATKGEPDKTRCPLSWRAWQIRRYVTAARGKIPGEKTAIAVSDGVVNGRPIRLVTTNNRASWLVLKSMPLNTGEQLDSISPQPNQNPNKTSPCEHAEDGAARYFRAHADTAAGVRMGTDPKACGWCTWEYANSAWITHERLDQTIDTSCKAP